MSIIHCLICEDNIDSDFIDCTETKAGDMCCCDCLEEENNDENN